MHRAALQHRQDLRSDGGERYEDQRRAPRRPSQRRRGRARGGGARGGGERGEEESAAARSPHETLDYWGYQTCTEFGFYQTCEVGTECFYTQGLDLLEDNDDFCQNWGIAPTDIQASIDATNQYYGAGRPNATRILYPNGDVDRGTASRS